MEYFATIISPFLSAYRSGYSCEAVLLHLIESWRQDLDKGKTFGSEMLVTRCLFQRETITILFVVSPVLKFAYVVDVL